MTLIFLGAWIALPHPSSAVTVLGTGTAALLGGDLTDPDDNIDDTVSGGANTDWLSASASSEAYFSPGGPTNEAAFDVFDNKVGAGSNKWCCNPPPQNVAVEFGRPYRLTHFTIASGNDTVGRDPTVWTIEGSNDGSTWTEIFRYDQPFVTPFSQRNQVLRYDAGTDFAVPGFFSHFRYRVETTNGAGYHQINEIELFGDPLDEHPDCLNDSWTGCSRARLEIENAFGQVDNPAYPPSQANFDAFYADYKDMVVNQGFEAQVICQVLVGQLVPVPAGGVYNASRQAREFFHICGWDEGFVDLGDDLAIWLDAEDFDSVNGRWPGKLGTPQFVPATDDGSYAFEAPTHKVDDLLGRDGVFFDGNHMLQADFASHEIGDTFTSFAVYRPERDSADTETLDTGLTDSIWVEIGASRSSPRHETSLHADGGDVVIEVVEATRIDGDNTQILKWRNGELVANEIHAFLVEGVGDAFDRNDGSAYATEWTEVNFTDGGLPLYDEDQSRLSWAKAGDEDDHVVLGNEVVNSADLDIRVEVGSLDSAGRHYVYFFYQDASTWYRLLVNRGANTFSRIERSVGGTVTTLVESTGDYISANQPLKAWQLTVARSGAIQFLSDGTLLLDATVDASQFSYQNSRVGLGGSGRRPVWDNFRFRVDDSINFDHRPHSSYGSGQDISGPVNVEDDGSALYLEGNRWKKIPFPYTITPNTVLEFDFESTVAGEVHAIGFDADNSVSEDRAFTLYNSGAGGTSNALWGIQDPDHSYSGSGEMHISIPVGQYYTGSVDYLFFVNDDDGLSQATSRFSNIRVREARNDGVALGCDHVVTDGSGNWDGSDCSRFTLGELLVYDKTLSSWERSNVEEYLSNKWGIWVANKDRTLRCLGEQTSITDYELLQMEVAFPDLEYFDDLEPDCSADQDHPDVENARRLMSDRCAVDFAGSSSACAGALAGAAWLTVGSGGAGAPIFAAAALVCGVASIAGEADCIENGIERDEIDTSHPETAYQSSNNVTQDHSSEYCDATELRDPDDCALNEEVNKDGDDLVDDLTEGSPRACCVAMVDTGVGHEPRYTSCYDEMPIVCNIASTDGTDDSVSYSNYDSVQFPSTTYKVTLGEYRLLDADVACLGEFANVTSNNLTATQIQFPVALWPNYTSNTTVANDFDSIESVMTRAPSLYSAPAHGLGGFGHIATCDGTQQNCQDTAKDLKDGRSVSGSSGGSGGGGDPGRKRKIERAAERIAKRTKFATTSRTDNLKKTHNALSVHAINVGQGTCHLVQCSQYDANGNHQQTDSVVVDCGSGGLGPLGLNNYFAAGYMLYNRFTPSSSPLFISHGDNDHWSALRAVYTVSPPPSVHMGGYLSDYRTFGDVVTQWKAARPTMTVNDDLVPGAATWAPGSLPTPNPLAACSTSLRLLSVNANLASRPAARVDDPNPAEKNGVSAILGIFTDNDVYGAILPGDAIGVTENAVSAADRGLFAGKRQRFLMSSHHGSETNGSNGQTWLDDLAPMYVPFSSGYPYIYGHPDEQVVDRVRLLPSLQNVNTSQLHTVAYSTAPGDPGTFRLTTKAYFSTHSNGTVVSRLWMPRSGSANAEHDITYAYDLAEFIRQIFASIPWTP